MRWRKEKIATLNITTIYIDRERDIYIEREREREIDFDYVFFYLVIYESNLKVIFFVIN